jgi:hypothetical protein
VRAVELDIVTEARKWPNHNALRALRGVNASAARARRVANAQSM